MVAPSSYSYNATFCDIMTLPLQCDISYCDIMSKDKVSFDILARDILLQCDISIARGVHCNIRVHVTLTTATKFHRTVIDIYFFQ